MGTLRRLLLLITAATLIFLSSNVQQVDSLGTLQLRLRKFSNLEGRDSTGGCCSGQQSADGSCRGTCSVSFRICIQHYQATVDPKQPCIFGEFITQVLENSSALRLHETNFSDPIDFNFDFTWPKTFSMIIEAWQGYGSKGRNRMLVSRFIAQRSLEVHPEWTQDVLTTNHSLLEISYRVQCETNYYGENCATLCKPRHDKFGHYTCRSDGKRVCMPGWKGNYCDVAMCLLGCHQTHGFCEQPNECKCRPGWEGSLCDTCTRYPGCIHGTCFKPWQCNCNEGWGGLFCDQDLNYCTNHKPCKNGGTCTNTGYGSYTCSCAEEYMGKNCDNLRNPCEENPCQNGGTCENPSEGNVTCQCALGFFGPRCETSASICTDNPCDNGGTCVHDPGGYICACPTGFYGTHCEKSNPSCEDNFCLNGGTCSDHSEGLVCHCLNSFSGIRCEEISKCVNDPCLNGGTCYSFENSFRCACPPGFSGPLCQITTNRCSLRPCANGGTCRDLINDYSCDCIPGFHGKNCSLSIAAASCSSSPCRNKAVCLEKPDGYLCHCAHGYYGPHCEFYLQSNVQLQNKPSQGDISTAHSTAISNVSHQVSDDDERLSTSEVALIATVSTFLPILAVVIVAVVLTLRRCRQRSENVPKDFEQTEEDEEMQNERNSMHMNNKCVHHTKIVNTLDRMPTKVTNEVPAKVLNTDVGSNKLSENKNLVCVQRTLDRKDHSSGYLDNGHQSVHEWSPSSGVYVIEDHFRSPPALETDADVFATEV